MPPADIGSLIVLPANGELIYRHVCRLRDQLTDSCDFRHSQEHRTNNTPIEWITDHIPGNARNDDCCKVIYFLFHFCCMVAQMPFCGDKRPSSCRLSGNSAGWPARAGRTVVRRPSAVTARASPAACAGKADAGFPKRHAPLPDACTHPDTIESGCALECARLPCD
jgi:hypothetical protein